MDDGAVAQLGERLNGIQEVRGSNPLSSTLYHQVGWYRGGKPFVPDRRGVFCYVKVSHRSTTAELFDGSLPITHPLRRDSTQPLLG